MKSTTQHNDSRNCKTWWNYWGSCKWPKITGSTYWLSSKYILFFVEVKATRYKSVWIFKMFILTRTGKMTLIILRDCSYATLNVYSGYWQLKRNTSHQASTAICFKLWILAFETHAFRLSLRIWDKPATLACYNLISAKLYFSSYILTKMWCPWKPRNSTINGLAENVFVAQVLEPVVC